MANDATADLKWKQQNGAAADPTKTGPSSDNTNNGANGYAYIDSQDSTVRLQ